MTGLSRRLALLLAPLLLLTLIAGGLLVGSRIDSAREDVREMRYTALALSLASPFEVNLDLGFPIEAQRGPLDDLRAAVGRDPSLLSIDVFDTTGRLIFTTDRGGVGDRVPPAWTAQLGEGAPRGWIVDEAMERVTGASIVNNFGKVVAGLALRRSADPGGPLLDSARVVMPVVIAFLLAALILLPAAWWIARPVERELAAAALRLAAPGDAPAVTALARAADAFRARAAVLRERMDNATRTLRRIDDES